MSSQTMIPIIKPCLGDEEAQAAVRAIRSGWVTQGPRIGQIALKYGANDFGSVMMEENVVSSAGTTFRLNKENIERLITEAGYEPHRRDNWYRLLN